MLIREVIGRSHGHNWHYLSHCGEPCPFLWHYHPEFELTLTRHSHGTRYIGSDVQSFGELDLALVAPNCAHTWHNAANSGQGSEQLQVVFFTLEWLQALAAEGLPELHAMNQWLAGVRQGVVFSQKLIERTLPIFDQLEAARGLERLAALLRIFDALPRDEGGRHLGASEVSTGSKGSDRRVEAALAHLQQHYRNAISLDTVAAVAATSTSTLKRLFQERLEMSVTDVLIQLRIGHACHLLVSTDFPIHRVASESGFNNLGHFFRQFAVQRDCTPADFRRRNQPIVTPVPGEGQKSATADNGSPNSSNNPSRVTRASSHVC